MPGSNNCGSDLAQHVGERRPVAGLEGRCSGNANSYPERSTSSARLSSISLQAAELSRGIEVTLRVRHDLGVTLEQVIPLIVAGMLAVLLLRVRIYFTAMECCLSLRYATRYCSKGTRVCLLMPYVSYEAL